MKVKLKAQEIKRKFIKKIEDLEYFGIPVFDDILGENIFFYFVPLSLGSYEILYSGDIIGYIFVDDFEMEIIFKKLNCEEINNENIKNLFYKLKR